MSQENNSSKVVGVAQAAAAGIGAVLIYVSQTGELGKHGSQILIYMAPVVSAVTGGFFVWVEDGVKEYVRDRRLQSRYRKVVENGNKLLKDNCLDEQAREQVVAAMNQARISYMHKGLSELEADLGTMRKTNSGSGRSVNVPKKSKD